MDYCNLALFSDLDGTLLDRNRQVSQGEPGGFGAFYCRRRPLWDFHPDARR